MPWDLYISNFNDLVFSPSHDFQTISGTDLFEQRIMLRLKMKRGSWIFDETKELGSNLDVALRMNQPDAMAELTMLVAEALDPVRDEITIIGTEITASESDSKAINLHVEYERVIQNEENSVVGNEGLTITIPLTG